MYCNDGIYYSDWQPLFDILYICVNVHKVVNDDTVLNALLPDFDIYLHRSNNLDVQILDYGFRRQSANIHLQLDIDFDFNGRMRSHEPHHFLFYMYREWLLEYKQVDERIY